MIDAMKLAECLMVMAHMEEETMNYNQSLEARLRDWADRFPGYSDHPELGKLLVEAANHIYAIEADRQRSLTTKPAGHYTSNMR